MKKNLLLVSGLLTSTLLFAGCKKATTPGDTATSVSPSGDQAGTNEQIKSWVDAVKAGGSLKCTMSNEQSGEKLTYVIKGKKVHMSNMSTGSSPADMAEMISDGTYMYSWSKDKKEGMKIKLPTEAEIKEMQDKVKTTKPNQPEVPNFSDESYYEKFENDGNQMSCLPTEVKDSEFVPPSDIKFQDLSEMMNSMMDKSSENMSDDQKKAIEDAMKKYGDQ